MACSGYRQTTIKTKKGCWKLSLALVGVVFVVACEIAGALPMCDGVNNLSSNYVQLLVNLQGQYQESGFIDPLRILQLPEDGGYLEVPTRCGSAIARGRAEQLSAFAEARSWTLKDDLGCINSAFASSSFQGAFCVKAKSYNLLLQITPTGYPVLRDEVDQSGWRVVVGMSSLDSPGTVEVVVDVASSPYTKTKCNTILYLGKMTSPSTEYLVMMQRSPRMRLQHGLMIPMARKSRSLLM